MEGAVEGLWEQVSTLVEALGVSEGEVLDESPDPRHVVQVQFSLNEAERWLRVLREDFDSFIPGDSGWSRARRTYEDFEKVYEEIRDFVSA